MKSISIGFTLILTAALLIAAQGTVPLKQAAEYRNHVEANGIGLGALVLNNAQIKQRFVTEFDRDYLVVEVALYPKEGQDLNIQPSEFVLYIPGEDRALRSENPKVIAASLQNVEESTRDITIIPQVGVGYETGRRGYDPTTGTARRTGGVYTSTGVAVVMGDSLPSNPKNEAVMALELSEKGLPEGTFAKPVSGHLYFRVSEDTIKDSKAKFELTFELDGKETTLALKR
ncbi:MAG: hypothetical protein JXA73_15260 [Acidobacteria bacterium]|nr:hypothetical protein [Acidobacteriota bacterium]